MHVRCTDPQHRYWKNYGGRGISVCQRWKKFSNFLADMGRRPENTTLDRVDNERNYFHGNCRWATRREQSINKRNNIVVTHGGRTMVLKDWASHLHLPYLTIYQRYKKGERPPRLFDPPRRLRRRIL